MASVALISTRNHIVGFIAVGLYGASMSNCFGKFPEDIKNK